MPIENESPAAYPYDELDYGRVILDESGSVCAVAIIIYQDEFVLPFTNALLRFPAAAGVNQSCIVRYEQNVHDRTRPIHQRLGGINPWVKQVSLAVGSMPYENKTVWSPDMTSSMSTSNLRRH